MAVNIAVFAASEARFMCFARVRKHHEMSVVFSIPCKEFNHLNISLGMGLKTEYGHRDRLMRITELPSMDEELIYKMTGKTPEEIDEAIEYMERRAKRTNEHQRITREIFDVQWPRAVKSGRKEDWEKVCIAIDGVIEYLQRNCNFFPNYERHMIQWETLKKVADCIFCDRSKPCDKACYDNVTKRNIAKVA